MTQRATSSASVLSSGAPWAASQLGETVHELAARIRHDAVTCDFPAIHDPLDEAMRTRFMCSVNNEAVLKALFKHKEGDLTFAKAVALAVETEEAAKETVHGSLVPRPD